MNKSLKYIINKFNPIIAPRGGTEIYGINRTIMAATLNELKFKEGAEVGVAEGYHAKVLCDANPSLKLHCVDIWEKYPGYEEYSDPEKCFEEAQARLKPYDCKFIKKYSMDAFFDFKDNSLDFVYIDGAHDFRSVADDICEWSRKVRVGGVVFGHDYKRSNSRSRFAVHVKDVVDAYMYSHGISPWFVLTNDIRDKIFGPDNPGWMYVRQKSDKL
ncbi:class I SAM-dependent methyltransferase [Candidatus Microgenomates bacterium]|nr:MAG: class I SAM-dependent methyltransferase [Candidatus Microgenomates bacterium]